IAPVVPLPPLSWLFLRLPASIPFEPGQVYVEDTRHCFTRRQRLRVRSVVSSALGRPSSGSLFHLCFASSFDSSPVRIEESASVFELRV
ncbi:hypothetical protein C8R46DRAFT_1114686, partial [Mycena filopes]